MDNNSEDDERDGLTSKRNKSRQDWLGWGNVFESWFQRRGDAYLNEQSVVLSDEMVGGRERVTTDEERYSDGVEER